MLRRLILLALLAAPLLAAEPAVERWGIFEVTLTGPADGNPFTDVTLTATFTQGDAAREVTGFYDGDGTYRIRFMPEATGEWRYTTHSNRPALDGRSGTLTVTPPSAGNHGPVRVHNTFHFAYADGAPFRELGTTCYAWIHQGDALEEQTLRTLAASPFNKIRMCVFPKNYDWNKNEPVFYPFAGTPPKQWDFTRFNPEFFHHLEKRLGQLRDLGLEADIILFHPYDRGRWGFDTMGAANDDRYLRYVVARLAAYRNVWWSLANEYDFMRGKTEADWDRFFQIVQSSDPSAHLRSIHNGARLYNHTLPWVTHVSIQNGAAVLDPERAMLYRDAYRKPIVFDEVKYEGDIPSRWGALSAEDMVLRFWQGLIAGTYVGHGETYLHPADDVLWWSKGGVLHGQSPARLAFLKKIMAEMPADGIDPIDKWQDERTGGKAGEFYLLYFGKDAPQSWPFALYKDRLTDGLKFSVEIIDTWNMTITPVPGVFVTKKRDNYVFEDAEKKSIALPGKLYIALRIHRVAGDATAPITSPPTPPARP
jgi:hypothetical protein